MEAEVLSSEMVLPPSLPFKRVQMLEKHPKGQSRGRHWKHLKQILQAENYLSYSADEPNFWSEKYEVSSIICFVNEFPLEGQFYMFHICPLATTFFIFAMKENIQPAFFLLLYSGHLADVNIESPPSMYPSKKYCDITGFVAPYVDPRTNLRYASPDVFKRIRMLPNEYVQRYLTVRNAAVVLK